MTEEKASEEYRPKVSAVIPNWNRKNDLREALEAIKAQTYPIEEIIIVDNNSSDGTREMMEEEYPEVQFIQSPHNIVIQALNIGAKTARGDIILHQDNDGVLEPKAVEKMIKVFASDPSIAVVHCENLYYDSGVVYDPLRWFTPEEHDSEEVFDVPSFHGNGAMIRRDVLEEIDYIEPEILLYQFERNISAKAIDRGYRIVFYPHAQDVQGGPQPRPPSVYHHDRGMVVPGPLLPAGRRHEEGLYLPYLFYPLYN